jgi:adenine/guanine phosphoribosyltransferase-like PRPP-binding protein
MKSVGAEIVGLSFLIVLDFLKGRERLRDYRLSSVLTF